VPGIGSLAHKLNFKQRKNNEITWKNNPGIVVKIIPYKGEIMRTKNFIQCFFIGLFLFAFVAGCAGNYKTESTGEYIDDSVLTTKVKTEIFNDPELKVFQINVETFKGVVQLSGFVSSSKVSARAVEVAGSVKGVQSVKNSLVVKN